MNWLEQGGGAFPLATSEQNDAQFGMSLRDWFAGQALAIMAQSNPNLPGDTADDRCWPEPEDLCRRRAKWAYMQADAMIAARAALQGETK